jgi:hypothetical protein
MMAEYIEREATIKAIVDSRNRYYNSASSQYLVGRCDGLDIAAGLLRVAPAADVAPVVRCKDCENSYYVVDGLICSYGPCLECHVPPEFWCAYGKRREDAHAQD